MMTGMIRLPHSMLLAVALLAAVPIGMASAQAHSSTHPTVLQLDIRGPIGPAVADYVTRGLEAARQRQAWLVVLRMDTPGGLDRSMRAIIRAILASPVPVAAFVAPPGARAASAGTYILMASHIAAMAPGTNLGAATPVQIGGPATPGHDQDRKTPPDHGAMHRKMVNDAAAYIRGLATMRGRNADWAEQAVRQAAAISAGEALKRHVVDLLARDVPELLRKLDGMLVRMQDGQRTLHLRDAHVLRLAPNWRERLLATITDPNVAYILMLLGIYGLFFELANPGFVLPGVIGGICLLLALFAFQALPVSVAGLALLLLGIAFMVAEAFVPSFGALGLGGIVAFIAGSIMLMDTGSPEFALSLGLVIGVALASALFLIFVVGMALKARRRPVVSGREEMVGARGSAIEDFEREGRIHVHGEIWQARSDLPVRKGETVRVTGIEGLTLLIEPEASGNTQSAKEETS